MSRKPDISQYETFDQITGRLDDIVNSVRDNSVSLERSLDLFEEAIALGSAAVEMVDATTLTEEEKAKLAGAEADAADAGADSHEQDADAS